MSPRRILGHGIEGEGNGQGPGHGIGIGGRPLPHQSSIALLMMCTPPSCPAASAAIAANAMLCATSADTLCSLSGGGSGGSELWIKCNLGEP